MKKISIKVLIAVLAISSYALFLQFSYSKVMSELFMVQGKEVNAMNLFNLSIESYKRSLRHNPENGKAYFNLGTAYSLSGQVELYKNTSELINVDDFRIKRNIFMENAMKAFDKSRESFIFPELYYSRGSAQAILNNTQGAIEDYEMLLKSYPAFHNDYSTTNIYETLRKLYFKQGKFELSKENKEKAEDFFTRFVENDYDNNLNLLREENIDEYLFARENVKDKTLVDALLMSLYNKKGDYSKSFELAQRIEETLGESKSLLDYHKALQAFQEGDNRYRYKHFRYNMLRVSLGESFYHALLEKSEGGDPKETINLFLKERKLFNLLYLNSQIKVVDLIVEAFIESNDFVMFDKFKEVLFQAKHKKLLVTSAANSLIEKKRVNSAKLLIMKDPELFSTFRIYLQKKIEQPHIQFNVEAVKLFMKAEKEYQEGLHDEAKKSYLLSLEYFSDLPDNMKMTAYEQLAGLFKMEGNDEKRTEYLMMLDEITPMNQWGVPKTFDALEKQFLLEKIFQNVLTS